MKYPATTLAAGISGKLYVHLTVLATGAVARAVITRRELSKEAQGEYDGPANLGEAALDKELLRVVQTLRFEASKVASDTVTIVQIFGIQ
ncbi:MAG: energy transducer TonB [Janthinobacterium lividum]